MKTANRSLEGSDGLSACVKLGWRMVVPASLPATSRHIFRFAPFCEQSGPTSARASRQFLRTIKTRQRAIPLSREDCCCVEAAMPHYPVDVRVEVSCDDDAAYEAEYEMGPSRPALTDISREAEFRGGRS